uniref:Uncharacterized protein n=1 Tax=Pseudomonas fluorescens TaxID=294 RepID=A0A5E6XQP2_PSEFL|nr:hypothetical protein PS652_05511 [Pseudomonas fluorescens]
MAHGRQKQGLGFVGRIGRAPRFFQCRGIFDVPGDIVEGIQAYILALVAGRDKAHLQVSAVDFQVGFTAIALVGASLQGSDQLGAARRLLGPLVFHQHLVIGTAHHAQPGGRGIDHHAAESLAFGDAVMGLAGRQDHLAAVPAIGAPAHGDDRDQQGAEACQRPQGIAEEAAVVDGIDRRPCRTIVVDQLEHQAFGLEVDPFMQRRLRPQRADQHLAGRRHQGEVVVDRPFHGAFIVIGLGQVEDAGDHHPGVGALDVYLVCRQLDTDIRQHARRARAGGARAIVLPADFTFAEQLMVARQAIDHGLDHVDEGFVQRYGLGPCVAGGGYGNVEVAVLVEQEHMGRLVMRGRPESTVEGRQVHTQGEDLGMFAGGDFLRVDFGAEGHGVGELLALVNVRAFFRQGFEQTYLGILVLEQLALVAALAKAAQEHFLLADVFHQPGKVKTHGVVLLFDQALKRPIAGTDQQQRQAEQHHHPFVQAQRTAGEFIQQGVVVLHQVLPQSR